MSIDGLITVEGPTEFENRSGQAMRSNNSEDFPSSEGWYMVNNLIFDDSWDYVRLDDSGRLEIQHFCSYGACTDMYGSSTYYCCSGNGYRVTPGMYAIVFAFQT